MKPHEEWLFKAEHDLTSSLCDIVQISGRRSDAHIGDGEKSNRSLVKCDEFC